MNHCDPGWTMDDDLRSFYGLFPTPNEKKSIQHDNELMELIWRNGHVLMQSQNCRKHQENTIELKQSQNPESSHFMQEDEWCQYAMDDSLVKEFGSDLLSDIPMIDTNKSNKEDSNSLVMPPPKFTQMACSLNSRPGNLSPFSRRIMTDMGLSNLTVGSSACGSNQVQNQTDVSYTMKDGSAINLPTERMQANTFDTTRTSSSGGSWRSFDKTYEPQSTSSLNRKRKGRDGEESECHSEEAEYESRDASKQKASTRKSRAAEVHNLSERRRRDKINEKMKALQELIPHCNKSDKASMLDEAIDYLKSLQLQLQLMWMGSGMAPMMFPNIQQYMSQVTMPSINNQIQLSRNPLSNHSSSQMPMCSSPNVNPVNFSAQMQNAHMPESYSKYFGYPHMQMPSQAMNLFAFGSHILQQNQTPAVAGTNSLPTAVIPSENQNGQLG